MSKYTVTVGYTELAWGVEFNAGTFSTAAEAREAALNAARVHEEDEDLSVSIWFAGTRLWTFAPREDAEGDCITRHPDWTSHISPLRNAA